MKRHRVTPVAPAESANRTGFVNAEYQMGDCTKAVLRPAAPPLAQRLLTQHPEQHQRGHAQKQCRRHKYRLDFRYEERQQFQHADKERITWRLWLMEG